MRREYFKNQETWPCPFCLNRDDLRLWLAPPLHKVLNYGFRCLCSRYSIFWVGLTFDRYFPQACETVKGAYM